MAILSVVVSLVILSEALSSMRHDPEYTIADSGIATNSGVYFGENWNEKGLIYLINSDGDVKAMVNSDDLGEESFDDLCLGDNGIYAMFSSLEATDDGDIVRVFRIFSFTQDLRVMGSTDRFILDKDSVTYHLSQDGNLLHVTMVSYQGDDINVYEFSKDSIIPITKSITVLDNKEKKDVSELDVPESILFKDNPSGTMFTDARYEGGVLTVLTERDEPTGVFVPDSRVKNIVDRMHFSIPQQMSLYREYISVWLIALILWLAFLVFVFFMLQRRDRMVYIFVIMDIIFFVLLLITFQVILISYRRVEEDENSRFAKLSLEYVLPDLGDLDSYDFDDRDFYMSDEYGKLSGLIKDFMKSGNNATFFRDVFIMRIKDGMIMVSGIGNNRRNASFAYGSGLTTLRDSLARHESTVVDNIRLDYMELEATGVRSGRPSAKYALVGLYFSGEYSMGFWNQTYLVLVAFILVFLIGSVLIAFISYLQGLDLHEFELAINDVALGRTKIRVPETPARDMKAMWNSLSEMAKRIEEINYDKFRIFEGYYRFAPKNIEMIMGKDSIFDVNNGDAVSIRGSLMLVSTEDKGYGERRIKSLKNIVSYTEHYTDSEEGILVSEDSSLSILQFLFLDNCRMVTDRAVQFLHRNMSDPDSGFISAFLYYNSFIYGVVGVNTQSLVFLTSPDSAEMEAYASWFEKMQIPLVVTGDIAERENIGQHRYIGYIELKNRTKKIRLYEVLDACEARQRQLKLANREKFEKSLEYFESRDFYLARNNLTEIIKECPEDEMAKWYIFECEKFLSGEAEEEEPGNIRIGVTIQNSHLRNRK
ncbi:MAG: hypothetical protein IJU87_01860 [Lachnospiraceae bacterium]|nr:hypothetical protein [Lachnospiraceae bacterium]